jgi:hypothetical protein
MHKKSPQFHRPRTKVSDSRSAVRYEARLRGSRTLRCTRLLRCRACTASLVKCRRGTISQRWNRVRVISSVQLPLGKVQVNPSSTAVSVAARKTPHAVRTSALMRATIELNRQIQRGRVGRAKGETHRVISSIHRKSATSLVPVRCIAAVG